MKVPIEFQKDILNNLSDEDLYLLIKSIPAEILLAPIKKRRKDFNAETSGYQIDIKSKMMVDKLPSIYFNRFKKGDGYITRIIASYAGVIINTINNMLIEKTKDKTYLSKAVNSHDITIFANLIEIILIQLKPENIKLFFKLTGYQLTISQNEYIDREIPLLIEKLKLRKKIEKKIRLDFDEKIIKFNNEHKEKIANFHITIDNLKAQIQMKEQEIVDCKKHTNDLINQLTQNKQATQTKMSKVDSSIIQLKDEIERAELQVLDKMALLAEQQTLNKDINKKLKSRNDEFSVLAKEKWEIENKKLISQHQNLDNDCGKLRNEEKQLKGKIEFLEGRVDYWDKLVSEYVDNIDKSIIENALNVSMLNFYKSTTKNDVIATDFINYPYIKESVKAENISFCANINTLAENIANNLETIGVGTVADETANYIIGVLAAGLVPLICGYKAREIATAVSVAYSGETPYIITLPNGYANAKGLADLYCQSNSGLILIEDAIGTMNENSLLPLLREKSQVGFSQKILILSAENMDSLKYMPNNLYNYVALISIERIAMSKKQGYIYSDAKDIMQRFSGSITSAESHKKMKKLLKNFKLSQWFVESRANVIAHSNEVSNLEQAVKGFARCELRLICKFKNMYEQIEKNIDLNDGNLGNVLLDIINGSIDE